MKNPVCIFYLKSFFVIQFIEPWQSLHKDLVYLILSCIDYFSQLRRNDFAQNTANFENCIKYFAKLCHVIEVSVISDNGLLILQRTELMMH